MSMSVVLFDKFIKRDRLLPLVATRPIGNLRIGIFTINKKWELIFQSPVSYLTTNYLKEKFPLHTQDASDNLLIKASILPNTILIDKLKTLPLGYKLVDERGKWIAARLASLNDFEEAHLDGLETIICHAKHLEIKHPEDIFVHNAAQIAFDLKFVPQSIHTPFFELNHVVGEDLYIDASAILHYVHLDSSKGPIYIGQNTILESGVIIQGPVAIGSNCRIKAGAVLYQNVTIGDGCTISGELNNTVIWGNSAKGHFGYLGCSVVGENCNLGAGTTNSNLKNDYSSVKIYDYSEQTMRNTGLTKCGAVIGDYSMLAIQSKITTGTVIGTGAQIAMSKFIPKFVPDFAWLTDDKEDFYIFERFIAMLERKAHLTTTEVQTTDVEIISYLYTNKKK